MQCYLCSVSNNSFKTVAGVKVPELDKCILRPRHQNIVFLEETYLSHYSLMACESAQPSFCHHIPHNYICVLKITYCGM
jgi:hypothetical protein